MPRYTDDTKQRVRDAVDMVDLVGTRTELKRSGHGHYMGRCCFHEERSPSLSVDAERKLYHCFGCQAGGDCFGFVQETEGTDFVGAIEFLAGRYGVTLEIVDDDPVAAARRKREQHLLALVERAAAFYERMLWSSPEGEPAKAYLLGRGLTEEALRTYRVGFAPPGWDRLVSASERAGVDGRQLAEAGLALPKRDGRGYNDRFRGRITFPLADARGHVRGFGARAMSADDQPKYLNTSENALFHKGRQLFGLHLARSAAAKVGSVVLVEGYTDVIALRQSGVEHVVALMGTAMTGEQVAELARLAPRLVLALDPDGAGEAAMEKAQALARGSRLELRVAHLPDGIDPADLIGAGRGEELVAALEQPAPFASFRVDRILKATGLQTTDERDGALAQAAPVLAALAEGALREDLLTRVAEALRIPPTVVDRVVRGVPAPAQERGPGPQPLRPGDAPVQGGGVPQRLAPRRLDPHDDMERGLLAMLMGLGDAGRRQLERLELEDFQVPHVRGVAAWLREGGDEGGQLPADDRLAEVARDVIMRSRSIDPRPALLEVELAQLDLRRLERQVAAARHAGEPVDDLLRRAPEIRRRLDDAMAASMDL